MLPCMDCEKGPVHLLLQKVSSKSFSLEKNPETERNMQSINEFFGVGLSAWRWPLCGETCTLAQCGFSHVVLDLLEHFGTKDYKTW
jgi:hypothetical protein